MSEAKPVSRWRRWLVGTFCGVGLVPIIIVLLLLTGWPQRLIVQRVLERASERAIQVKGLSTLGGHVKASDIQVAQKDAPLETPPMLRVTDLDVDYALWPHDSRYLPSVGVKSLEFHLRTDEGGISTARERGRSGPRKPQKSSHWDPLPILPKAVRIDDMRFSIESRSGGFALNGLGAQSTIEATNKFQVALNGQAVETSYWLGNRETGRILPRGLVSISTSMDGAVLDVRDLTIQLPGLLDVAARGNVKMGGILEWDIGLGRFVAEQIDLMQAGTSFPVSFKRLDASGTHLIGRLNRGDLSLRMPGAVVHLAADSLALGRQGAEIYEGNLLIDGSDTGESGLQFGAQTTLNRGQKLQTSLSGNFTDLAFRAGLENWSRDDLLAVVPKTFRPKIEAIRPLQGLSAASLDAHIMMLRGDASVTVKPLILLPDGSRPSVEIAAEAKNITRNSLFVPRRGGGDSIETTASVRVAEESLSFAGRMGAKAGVDGTFTLDRFNAARWTQAFAGITLPPALSGVLNGTVGLKASSDLKFIETKLDVAMAPAEQTAEATQDALTFKIAGVATGGNDPFWHVSAPQIDLAAGEAATVSIKNVEAEMASITGKMDLSGNIDLSLLASYLPGSDLRGLVTFQTPIQHEKGVTKATMDAKIEGLGYGAFAAPYATPVEVKGRFSYDNLNRKGKGSDCLVSLGEGTRLSLASCTLATAPLAFDTPFTFETDAKPLVDMGWLTSVEGKATVSGALRYGTSGLLGNATLDVAAVALAPIVVPAVVSGLTAKGGVQRDEGTPWKGSGDLAADKALVLGASCTGLKGPWMLENNVLKAKVEGGLCQGSVILDAALGTPGGSLIEMTAQLKDSDLEMFCHDMGYPAAPLTGLADGTLVLKAGMDGIAELRFNLISTRNFTVSRALLEQISASQYAGSSVMKMVIDKMGKEPQVPFDSGRLEAHLEGGRVVGSATLATEQRTFTIDLRVDMGAIMEGITWIQENSLKDIQGVSTGEGNVPAPSKS